MVKVDKITCIGCQVCTTICDDVFEMIDTDDGEKAIVKSGKDNDDSNDLVKEAIEMCPVDAIS